MATEDSNIISRQSEEGIALETNFADILRESMNMLGAPPQFSRFADPRYYESNNVSTLNVGRVYLETYMNAPTTLSLAPRTVTFDPLGLSSDSIETIEKTIIEYATGSSDGDAVSQALDGYANLYSTKSVYSKYYAMVNYLLRMLSVYMGIGKKDVPWDGTVKYYRYNWQNYTMNGGSERPEINTPKTVTNEDGSTTTLIWDDIPEDEYKSNNDRYINFYLSGDSSSVSESSSISVSESQIASGLKQVLDPIASEINYFFGDYGVNPNDKSNDSLFSKIQADFDSISAKFGGDNVLSTLLKKGTNAIMEGAKFVFPKKLEDFSYSKSMSCTLRLVATCGSPECIFLRCYVPMIHMFPFCIPQQVDANMYTFPIMAKVCCKGWFNSDIAAITDFNIKKGGGSDRSYAAHGLPTEVELSFTITPLFQDLMLPAANSFYTAALNPSMQQYIATFAGVNLTERNFDILKEAYEMQFSLLTRLTDGITSFESTVRMVWGNLYSAKTGLWESAKGVASGLVNTGKEFFNFFSGNTKSKTYCGGTKTVSPGGGTAN